MEWITAAAEEQVMMVQFVIKEFTRYEYTAEQTKASVEACEMFLREKAKPMLEERERIISLCRANLHSGVNPGRQEMAGEILDAMGVERFEDLSKGNKEQGNG